MKILLKHIWILAIVSLFFSCEQKLNYYKIDGQTMGTYYAVTFQGQDPEKMHERIDKLLVDYNNVLSAYIPSSTIRRLNDGSENIKLSEEERSFFQPVIEGTNRLTASTGGALNPSISPVVNYWGFGYTGKKEDDAVDSSKVRELTALALKSSFTIEGNILKKHPENAEVDYSSLAKGYGIDVIAQFLNAEKIENYLIDIGGEARAKGLNKEGVSWRMAINKPKENAPRDEMELIISLDNKSIATSGNYLQFYESKGKKFAHIIDPNTGFPALSDILSASIITSNCMDADGLATAMCVMGLEKAKKYLENNKDVAACLIYDADGDDKLEKFYANGFEEYVLQSQ